MELSIVGKLTFQAINSIVFNVKSYFDLKMIEISEEVNFVMPFYYGKSESAAKKVKKSFCDLHWECCKPVPNARFRFRTGHFDFKNSPRSGPPASRKAVEIPQLVNQVRHAIFRAIVEALAITHVTVWSRLKKYCLLKYENIRQKTKKKLNWVFTNFFKTWIDGKRKGLLCAWWIIWWEITHYELLQPCGTGSALWAI